MRLNRFFIKEVWRELLASKVNLFFIILALTFSLTALNTIYALGKSAEKQVLDTLSNLNFGKDAALVLAGGMRMMGLMITRTDTLKMEDVEAIERLNFVKLVSPMVGKVIEVAFQGRVEKLRMEGVLPNYTQANNWRVIQGKFITEEDVKNHEKIAVLGFDVSKKLGIRDPLGKKIKIGDQYYTVVGVLEKKGSLGHYPLDERIFVPLTTAQRRIFNVDYLTGFKIIFFEGTDLNQAMKTIRNILRERHKLLEPQPDDFRIITPDMAVERFTKTSRTLSAFLLSIALISLVISGVIIMNLMTASVEEKAGIIALRIALGATKRDILSHYLFSAVLIAVICGVIGWITSVALMKLISLFTPLKPLFSWGTFILSLSFSLLACVLFSIFPALRASKVDPVILLKSL